MLPNRFLVDKTPTEAMTKNLQDFKRLNFTFINCDDCEEDELSRCYWEHVGFYFFQTHEPCKSKFMQWMLNQLNNDLHEKFKDEHNETTNWRDFLN